MKLVVSKNSKNLYNGNKLIKKGLCRVSRPGGSRLPSLSWGHLLLQGSSPFLCCVTFGWYAHITCLGDVEMMSVNGRKHFQTVDMQPVCPASLLHMSACVCKELLSWSHGGQKEVPYSCNHNWILGWSADNWCLSYAFLRICSFLYLQNRHNPMCMIGSASRALPDSPCLSNQARQMLWRRLCVLRSALSARAA
jgi:hypothetical protein